MGRSQRGFSSPPRKPRAPGLKSKSGNTPQPSAEFSILDPVFLIAFQPHPPSSILSHHVKLPDFAQERQGENPGKRFSHQAGALRSSERRTLRAYSKHGRSDVGRMADPRRRAVKRNTESENIRANVRSEKKAPSKGPFFACCLPYKFALFYAQPTSAGSPEPACLPAGRSHL